MRLANKKNISWASTSALVCAIVLNIFSPIYFAIHQETHHQNASHIHSDSHHHESDHNHSNVTENQDKNTCKICDHLSSSLQQHSSISSNYFSYIIKSNSINNGFVILQQNPFKEHFRSNLQDRAPPFNA